MPNIEIHGIESLIQGYSEEKIIREKIRKATEHLPFSGEIIVTTVLSWSEDKLGRKKNFLRILAGKDKLDQLIKALRPINLDMEILPVDFIPKR